MSFKKNKSMNILMNSFTEEIEKYISYEIKIIDTGGGISEEGMKNLFSNFGKLEEN